MTKTLDVVFDDPCLARFNSRYQLKIIRILIVMLVFMLIVFLWVLVILFENRNDHGEIIYDELKDVPYEEKHNEILQKNLEPTYGESLNSLFILFFCYYCLENDLAFLFQHVVTIIYSLIILKAILI